MRHTLDDPACRSDPDAGLTNDPVMINKRLRRAQVDDQTRELVAMGAAAAANCHPCLDFHLAKCDELGIDREEIIAAVKVGLTVNRGAENAIRKKARSILGEMAIAE